jgi:hypothetical protein
VITQNGDGLVCFFYVLVHNPYSELILIVLYTCRSLFEPNFLGVGHLKQVNKILDRCWTFKTGDMPHAFA